MNVKSDNHSKFSNLSNCKEEASKEMCGFIAQLVEHRTGIAEVTGSNPVEALIFFRLLLSSSLNWKIYCDDHSSHTISNFCEQQKRTTKISINSILFHKHIFQV